MADMSLWGQKRYPNRFAPFVTPLEIPASGVFDPPYICVPINIHWAAIVRGALSSAQRDEIWQGDENQRFDAIQQILELTAAMVNQRPECEAACMIRVDPTDSCQIQQSLNGGETWDDIFRLDSCFVTPIVQVEAVEGGNLVRFDMNADSFPEEEVFIPDGVQGDPGDPGDPAPTPIVTISEPTPGNHLIEFDMDGNGIPEDAVLISDGENAAVPIVSVNAVEGGTNVAFDMNADTFPEETVFIPDGVQGDPGDPAPTPIVSVNAVEGGNLVSFDMDADTIPEEFVFIPDGENGATVIQDVSEPELPPADMGVDLRCNSALHTAEKMQQYLLEHLDQFDLALDLQSALVSIVVGISNIAGRLGRLGEDYEVFEEINEVGSSSLRTIINSTAWVNDIKCLAYGILDSDGVWDDTKVTAFIDAIEASSVGAKTFTATWLRAVKLYGFSYSARLEQNASADCSDCGTPGSFPPSGEFADWNACYGTIGNTDGRTDVLITANITPGFNSPCTAFTSGFNGGYCARIYEFATDETISNVQIDGLRAHNLSSTLWINVRLYDEFGAQIGVYTNRTNVTANVWTTVNIAIPSVACRKIIIEYGINGVGFSGYGAIDNPVLT